jgi:hypothetical protein
MLVSLQPSYGRSFPPRLTNFVRSGSMASTTRSSGLLASATSLSKFTGQVLSSSVNRYWTQVKHPTVPSLLVLGSRFFERLVKCLLHSLPKILGQHFLHIVPRVRPSWYPFRSSRFKTRWRLSNQCRHYRTPALGLQLPNFPRGLNQACAVWQNAVQWFRERK